MAGKPRTPSNVLKLKGSDKRHPERMKEREGEPQDDRPLGDPPEYLTDSEKQVWAELKENAIEGVLTHADRHAVETTAKLLSRMREDARDDEMQRSQVEKALRQVEDEPTHDALVALYRFFGSRRPFGSSDQSNLTTLLRQMGMTPADRSKISLPKKDEGGNTFAED